jgi:hypothetical protein
MCVQHPALAFEAHFDFAPLLADLEMGPPLTRGRIIARPGLHNQILLRDAH